MVLYYIHGLTVLRIQGIFRKKEKHIYLWHMDSQTEN